MKRYNNINIVRYELCNVYDLKICKCYDTLSWCFQTQNVQRRLLALSMAVLIALQIQLCAGTNENDIIKFIYNRIPLLRTQARNNRHFSAIVLLSETEVKNISQFKFLPHHTDGSAYVNNSLPFSPVSPQNYIVARPNALSEESVMHAEVILLEQLPRAWNSFLGCARFAS